MKKVLVVLLGPTAVGKTELSLNLAGSWSCPIISADSRQVYKGIPIGTAAPTDAQLSAVRHYFVNMLDLDAYYSAAKYEEDVLRVLDRHFQTSDRAILCGGSMMYIDAVCNGIDDIPTVRPEIREALRSRYEKEGLEPLKEELSRLDPLYYSDMDTQNPKRVIHALEICHQTHRPYSSFRVRKRKQRPFEIVKIGLYRPRNVLFSRINRRVDQMMSEGLLDEARQVYPQRQLNSLNTVGYKELFEVFSGNWPLEMAVDRIKKNTRVYAKKQMTWFKQDPSVWWLNLDDDTLDTLTGKVNAIVAGVQQSATDSSAPSAGFRISSW